MERFPIQNGTRGTHTQRHSVAEFSRSYRTNGNGPMPIPSGPPGMNGDGRSGHMHRRSTVDGPGLDLSRSPPNNKNLAHVPCKFFRQGNCQAGKACPFSHAIEERDRECKYFARGNCKFGHKCENAHYLPDGRRVNGPNLMHAAGPFAVGGRFQSSQHTDHMPPAVPSTIPSSQHAASRIPYENDFYASRMQQSHYEHFSGLEPQYSSHPGSIFGSPPNYGSPPGAERSAMSPSANAVDVPLPPTFDRWELSHVAKCPLGNHGASCPNHFGRLSPTSTTTSIAVSTAFGNLNQIARTATGKGHNLDPSTSSLSSEPIFANRFMHSELRSKPIGISHSLGSRFPPMNPGIYSVDDFGYLPQSLHDDLNIGSPPEPKVGSPSHHSPSRYGSFFTSMQKKENNDSFGSSIGPSPFGHVGSPLRNSSLKMDHSPSSGPISRPRSRDVSPAVLSPPRYGEASMLSQALRRTRLDSKVDHTESGANSYSNGLRSVSSPVLNGRALSSSSVGRVRIDEEPCVFPMDEEEEKQKETERRMEAQGKSSMKRHSGGAWNVVASARGRSSSRLGPNGAQNASNGNGINGI